MRKRFAIPGFFVTIFFIALVMSNGTHLDAQASNLIPDSLRSTTKLWAHGQSNDSDILPKFTGPVLAVGIISISFAYSFARKNKTNPLAKR